MTDMHTGTPIQDNVPGLVFPEFRENTWQETAPFVAIDGPTEIEDPENCPLQVGDRWYRSAVCYSYTPDITSMPFFDLHALPQEFPNRPGGTVRIRHIPAGVSEAEFRYALISIMDDEDKEMNYDCIHITMAPDPSSASQVASVALQRIPAQIMGCVLAETEEVVWMTEFNGKCYLLLVDIHFYGMTPVNKFTENPMADIIFVTGLSAHTIGSWTDKEDPDYLWPRDALPHDLNRLGLSARIMMYGYDSRLEESQSTAKVEDYALELVQAIAKSRNSESEKNRPLILIGYSLGGIVINQALVIAAKSSDSALRDIYSASTSILLFGTPHFGMNIDPFLAIAGDGPNREFLLQFAPKSIFLSELQDKFYHSYTHPDSRAVSFYETQPTKVLAQDEEGFWERGGDGELTVDQDGARIRARCIRKEEEMGIAMEGDHSTMVKFDRDDTTGGYRKVFDIVAECVRTGRSVVEKRLKEACVEK